MPALIGYMRQQRPWFCLASSFAEDNELLVAPAKILERKVKGFASVDKASVCMIILRQMSQSSELQWNSLWMLIGLHET